MEYYFSEARAETGPCSRQKKRDQVSSPVPRCVTKDGTRVLIPSPVSQKRRDQVSSPVPRSVWKDGTRVLIPSPVGDKRRDQVSSPVSRSVRMDGTRYFNGISDGTWKGLTRSIFKLFCFRGYLCLFLCDHLKYKHANTEIHNYTNTQKHTHTHAHTHTQTCTHMHARYIALRLPLIFPYISALFFQMQRNLRGINFRGEARV